MEVLGTASANRAVEVVLHDSKAWILRVPHLLPGSSWMLPVKTIDATKDN
jgi:hypothetical protein